MAINPEWDAIFQKRQWQLQPAAGVVLLFTNNFYHSNRPTVPVLDLGCGNGANLWWLSCEGYPVYGIDGSPTAIKQAKELLDEVNPGWAGQLRTGDLCELPYPDNSFDAVVDVAASACNPFQDMKRIFAEVERVLRPGGFFHSRIFREGTDPACLQANTMATFVTEPQLKELYGEFFSPAAEAITRPFYHLPTATKEWLITTRKVFDDSQRWKNAA